jgi:hypothetical protein
MVERLGRGCAWFDTGTHESLLGIEGAQSPRYRLYFVGHP